MRLLYFILILSFAISCKQKQENINKVNKSSDSLKQETSIKKVIKTNQPQQKLISFCKKLKEIGFRADTTRAKKITSYKSLRKSKTYTFQNFPFYKLSYDDTEISLLNDSTYIEVFNVKVNSTIFKKQKSIWAYFYRGQKEANSIPDGVIEQWEFEDEIHAKKATLILDKVDPLPFFNTNPYYKQEKNYLIIFHTRAMAYSYMQKELFNMYNK